FGCRDLDISRLPFDNADPMSGPLGERRFVGGADAERECFAQDLGSKGLWGLREKDCLARERLCNHPVIVRQPGGGRVAVSLVASGSRIAIGPLDGIAR